MRAFDWDPIRAEHYGQRLHRRTKQAGHMTAPDQCCSNSESSCQGGAVHTCSNSESSCQGGDIDGTEISQCSGGCAAVAGSPRRVCADAQMAPFGSRPPGKSPGYYEETCVVTVFLAGICLTVTFLPPCRACETPRCRVWWRTTATFFVPARCLARIL